jgi:hypothetical protein
VATDLPDARPLAIDLYCGLGGWTEGLMAEGFRVIGFDLERHEYGEARYPGELVLQDVLTLDGAQFAGAALIVGSSPCQEFSYRAMPWSRARALGPPELGMRLFEAQFRIQREASAAAGRHIPMVVENVKGAQKWVGRSRWNFGSFHLWGDVPALMPMRTATKNAGGSWFNVAHNTTSGKGQNPDGRKVPGQDWSRFRKTGEVSPHWREEGLKVGDQNAHRAGAGTSPHFTNPDEGRGVKHSASGRAWFDGVPAAFGSGTSKRKAASAHIAKIPTALARHIGAVYFPRTP